MTMRKPEDYRVDVKNYCGLCHDAYEEKIHKLEQRYAALVEVTTARTEQVASKEYRAYLNGLSDPRD
jgi:hypothetical protein